MDLVSNNLPRNTTNLYKASMKGSLKTRLKYEMIDNKLNHLSNIPSMEEINYVRRVIDDNINHYLSIPNLKLDEMTAQSIGLLIKSSNIIYRN